MQLAWLIIVSIFIGATIELILYLQGWGYRNFWIRSTSTELGWHVRPNKATKKDRIQLRNAIILIYLFVPALIYVFFYL